MPRVSDAYRTARRDQIVEATLRVLERRSFHDLTMAHIIEQAGLSAGSVYSHFSSKAEILDAVASRVIGERLELLGQRTDGAWRTPAEIVEWALGGLVNEGVPFAAVVQIWGEAASTSDMRELLGRRMSATEDAFRIAVTGWLDGAGRDPALAPVLAKAMVTFCQGFVVRSAVLGPQDLAEASAAFGALVG